jgi:hypothetical protein
MVFFPLLVLGGRFNSETAARKFQKQNGRCVAVPEAKAKRLKTFKSYDAFNGHSPTGTSARSVATVM